jgi:hypothetical protein
MFHIAIYNQGRKRYRDAGAVSIGRYLESNGGIRNI